MSINILQADCKAVNVVIKIQSVSSLVLLIAVTRSSNGPLVN